MEEATKTNCPFCGEFDKDRVIYEDSTWVVVEDGYPVSKGHCLIIPKRHVEDYFSLNWMETQDLPKLLGVIKIKLDCKYHPNGYNVGFNCGKAAGQTVPHFHLHVIPRYDGDMDDPRGGVRGVIPSKQKY